MFGGLAVLLVSRRRSPEWCDSHRGWGAGPAPSLGIGDVLHVSRQQLIPRNLLSNDVQLKLYYPRPKGLL